MFRIFGRTWDQIVGVPTSNGCDPLAPERAIQARLAFAHGPRWGTCYQVENAASPVLALMNARVLLAHAEVAAPGLRLAGEAAGYKIYENLSVMDRFFFAKQVRSVDNLGAAAAIVQSPEFRPLEVAIAEAPGERFDVAAGPTSIRVIEYSPTAIRLETEASGAAFLVATESYYPGWEASVDGNPVHIYPADAAFRGLRIPGGKHAVEFRFVPKTLYRAAAMSAAALVGLVILCLV